MRILLTNDDGVNAPGLQLLCALAQQISNDIWIIAPANEQSAVARALSLGRAVRVSQCGPRAFAVDGTPVDCVRIGVLDLLQGRRPDLVLSGINRGQNVGDDLTVSGTVAAALESSALGIRAIALNQSQASFAEGSPAHWETAEFHCIPILRRLLEAGWPTGSILNVNFPSCGPRQVKGVRVTAQGMRLQNNAQVDRRRDPRGRLYYWMTFSDDDGTLPEDTDLSALRDNFVSVTPLHTNLTHKPAVASLRIALN